MTFYLPNTMDGNDTAELKCTMTKAEMAALVEELDRLCAKFPHRPEASSWIIEKATV